MAICGGCGATYGAGTQFCPRCGRSLPTTTTMDGRSGRRIEVVRPRLYATVPPFVAAVLQPDEDILAAFPALVRPNRRKAETVRRKVVLTTRRLIIAKDGIFRKKLDDVPYKSISGVSHDKRFLRGHRTVIHIPRATLTIPVARIDDASFLTNVVSGSRSGVAFTTHAAGRGLAPSAPLPYAAPSPPHAWAAPEPRAQAGGSGAGRIDLDAIDPLAFEELVRQLFERMGYQATLTKASHDGGIDIEVHDPTPIRGGRFLVQCKRYSGVVGAPYVRDLFGVVQGAGATKGILVTTSHFSADARAFAQGKPLELIDRAQLEALLRAHGMAATGEQSAPVIQRGGVIDGTTGDAVLERDGSLPTAHASAADHALGPARTRSGWRLFLTAPVYGVSALCVLAAFRDGWGVALLGADLFLITLLASDAWGLRQRLSLFNPLYKWASRVGYTALISVLVVALANVPTYSAWPAGTTRHAPIVRGHRVAPPVRQRHRSSTGHQRRPSNSIKQ